MYLLIVELVIDEFNLGLIDSLSDVRQHLESFKDFILSGVQDSCPTRSCNRNLPAVGLRTHRSQLRILSKGENSYCMRL